jgi:hypothetical protein
MAEDRTESQGFYEMLWDCDHCETKGLLGKSQRHCAECGAKQNPDKRYFPKEGEQTRIDGHKYEGADRYCPSCNAAQSLQAKNCTNCGAPQDGAKEVRGVVTPVAPPKKKRWRIPVLIGVVVVGGIVGIVLGVKHCNRTEEKQMTVAAHRWERSFAVEEFGDIKKETWREEVPSDVAFPVCNRKQRSSRKIPDGEECTMKKVDKKDGTFEQVKNCKPKFRSEAIEDDWCHFTVPGWKPTDSPIKLTGTGMTPKWPSGAGVPPEHAEGVRGARRQGRPIENLILDLKLADKVQTCESVAEPVWRKLADGAAVKVQVKASSGDVECDSLK